MERFIINNYLNELVIIIILLGEKGKYKNE